MTMCANADKTEPEKIFYCDYCEEVAVGLGVDEYQQLVLVCNGHRGTAERLLPIPPKWERKTSYQGAVVALALLEQGRITKRAALERTGWFRDVDEELRRQEAER